METAKNVNVKNETEKKVSLSEKMKEFNLSFASKKSGLNSGNNIYKKEAESPKGIVYKDCNTDKLKKKFRKDMREFRNEILFFIKECDKKNDKKGLFEAVKMFDIWYKHNYLINNYTADSLCQANTSEDNTTFIKTALEIVKRELKIS